VEDWSNETDCQVWWLTKTYGLRVKDFTLLIAIVLILSFIAIVWNND